MCKQISVLAAPVPRSGLKSVRSMLCVYAAPFVKYSLSQPQVFPLPSPVLLFVGVFCPAHPPAVGHHGAFPSCLQPPRGWGHGQQAWWERAGEVRELGAQARGPRGVGTAASHPPGEPRAVPPHPVSAPVLTLTLIHSKLPRVELPLWGTAPPNARQQS